MSKVIKFGNKGKNIYLPIITCNTNADIYWAEKCIKIIVQIQAWWFKSIIKSPTLKSNIKLLYYVFYFLFILR
jgi:hypothetical protein